MHHRPPTTTLFPYTTLFRSSDYEIGRVIQAVEDMGKLDNTLIIYINGDNGTSAEGGPLGTPNEVAFFNGINMMPVADRKSTRLNSSHRCISYAVFCLKKKRK